METVEYTQHNSRQNWWTKKGNVFGIIQLHEI
jgi:hypothetical protein